MNVRKEFRVASDKSKAFDDFAERHGLSLTEAFSFLVDAIPLVEAAMQTQTDQVEPKTGASGSSLLSPTLSNKEENRDSPKVTDFKPGTPDPLPLGINSSTKPTASTAISTTSNSGLSAGNDSKMSSALLERLRYQQIKAEIWQRSRVETEKEIQAVREQVRRFHSNDGRRAPVDYEGDNKEADHGRPDWYDH